jgi:hypothetical protein
MWPIIITIGAIIFAVGLIKIATIALKQKEGKGNANYMGPIIAVVVGALLAGGGGVASAISSSASSTVQTSATKVLDIAKNGITDTNPWD